MKVLALHGWLDNAASFHRLAPLLPECEVVALDFPGHGHSDHRAPGHVYSFVDYVLEIPEVLESLGWESVCILGHSMGGAIGHLFSVACPEQVESLIMMENLGPVPPWRPGTAAKQLSRAVSQWWRHSLEHRRFYTSVNDALMARAKATPLSPSDLRPLVERGLTRKTDDNGRAGYHWRTDKRLRLPSLLYLAEEQIQELLRSTSVPCQVILADPVTEALDYPSRKKRIQSLNPDNIQKIAGCHHLHLSSPEPVAAAITDFLFQEN